MPPSTKHDWTNELAHEHAHLGNLLGRVKLLLNEVPDGSRDETLGLLMTTLAAEVREHMEFEERDGYLAPVQQRMPSLFDTIEQLRGEHSVLQSQLALLIADAQVKSGVYAFREEISPRILHWLDSMRDHERRENLLVQEAFNTDISASD